MLQWSAVVRRVRTAVGWNARRTTPPPPDKARPPLPRPPHPPLIGIAPYPRPSCLPPPPPIPFLREAENPPRDAVSE